MTYQLHVIPAKKRRIMNADTTVKTPYGLQVIESCLTCPLVKDRIFCDLSRPALAALDSISSSATYPKDAVLFVEGQEPRGVFVICNSRVKLSTNSAGGQSLIVRIAEPGEIVGLPGTLSGTTYELTAEALEPVQANFIPRNAFMQYLKDNGEAAPRFLLDLPPGSAANSTQVRKTLTLTHKEIGEMIGASRETVTRLFASFKREGLIEVHGSALIISNPSQLASMLEG